MTPEFPIANVSCKNWNGNIEAIKSHIIRQLEKPDNCEHKAEWIDTVKNATTIKDIISGD